MQQYWDTLAACPLFEGIPRDELPTALACLGAKPRSYAQGAYILRQGEAAGQVGVVLDGHAAVVREEYEGNSTLQATLAPGELFAETLAAAGVETMPLSVTAITGCSVLLFPYSRMAKSSTGGAACGHYPALQRNLLGILARKNLLLNNRLRHLSQRSIRARVLSYLGDFSAAAQGGEFTLPVNRQGMADLLCVDRSALSAELSRMRDDGLLRFHRSRFQLL